MVEREKPVGHAAEPPREGAPHHRGAVGKCPVPLWKANDFVCEGWHSVGMQHRWKDMAGDLRVSFATNKTCKVRCPSGTWQSPDITELICLGGQWLGTTDSRGTFEPRVIRGINCKTPAGFKIVGCLILLGGVALGYFLATAGVSLRGKLFGAGGGGGGVSGPGIVGRGVGSVAGEDSSFAGRQNSAGAAYDGRGGGVGELGGDADLYAVDVVGHSGPVAGPGLDSGGSGGGADFRRGDDDDEREL